MNKEYNILNAINNVSDNMSYNEAYSYDIWFTIIVFIIFILLIIYFYVIANLKKLNNDWDNIRCNPVYIPFSYTITGGKHTMTGNFKKCLDEFTYEIAEESSSPFEFIFIIIKGIFRFLYRLFIEFKILIIKVIDFLLIILKYIYIKFKLLTNEVTYMFIKIRDIFDKSLGSILLFFYSITKIVDFVKYLLILVCNWYFKCIVTPMARITILFLSLSMWFHMAIFIVIVIMAILIPVIAWPAFWGIYAAAYAIFIALTVILILCITGYTYSKKIYIPILSFGLNFSSSVMNFVNSFGTKMSMPEYISYIKKAEDKQSKDLLSDIPSFDCLEKKTTFPTHMIEYKESIQN